MNRTEMIKAVGDQGHVLALLVHCGPQKAEELFADGYAITAKLLDVMYCMDFPQDVILSCVSKAKRYVDAESFYNWLCAYLGQDEAEDFLLENTKPDDNLLQKFSYAGLERHQCWDALQKKRADDILFRNQIYEKMSLHSLYTHKLYELYFKRGGVEINPNDTPALDYLAKKQKWDVLHKNLQDPKKKNNRTLLDFMVKNKQFDSVLAVNPSALTRYKEGIAFLQNKKQYSVLAAAQLYDQIDWDAYLKENSRQSVIDAVAAKQWNALVRNKKRWALLKNLRIKQFFESFRK